MIFSFLVFFYRFSFLPYSDSEYFQRYWLHPDLPVYFWGDLDFAGMSILKGLRLSLPTLRAWEPGYQPLLELLESGGGHSVEQAAKQGQSDPGTSGCSYADQVLLPALRTHRRFVDQEFLSPTRLRNHAPLT